jgi:hypothetical protein
MLILLRSNGEEINMTKQTLNTSYQIAPQLWEAITSEVNRLLPSIQSGEELTPDDVKEVRRLVGLVQNASKQYNKALTESYRNYKSILEQKLIEIGYGQIDAYITQKRKEQQTEISNRLTEKVNRFTNYVQSQIQETEHLKETQFVGAIPGQLMTLFPNVNSGAQTKEIKNWQPIEDIIREMIHYADTQITPIIKQIPSSSNIAQTFGKYFTTGDRTLIHPDNLKANLQLDQEWLREKMIAEQLTSEETLLQMIGAIAAENTNDSLSQIRQLIGIWDRRHTYK